MHADLSRLRWFKSSHSSGDGQCVMGARLPDGHMAIKDSKSPDIPVLIFPAREWAAFVRHVKEN